MLLQLKGCIYFYLSRIQFQISSVTQIVEMRLELFGLLLTEVIPSEYFKFGQLSLASKSH